MTISIGSTSSTSALDTIQQLTAATSSSATTSATGATSTDSASVSGPGEMLSKLKKLQQSDPTKFKAVMQQISSKLTDAAGAATDPKAKTALTDLAKKFDTAGQSGELSALQPPGGAGGAAHAHHHHGGGGHGGGGASAAAASSTSGSSAAADTNGDGTVSADEMKAYQAQLAATSATSVSTASSAAAYQKVAEHSGREGFLSTVKSIVDAAIAG